MICRRHALRGEMQGFEFLFQPGTRPGLSCVATYVAQNVAEEASMKNAILILGVLVFGVLILGVGAASAKDAMQGTLISENSVQCGSQAKGKKTSDLMCQEYVIRTATTEYHVRQEREGHKEMLPVNSPVELTISKDKMKFKLNGKGYEMLIVSEAAVPAAGAAPASAPKQ
jgi:hypothetical protein